MERWQNRVAVVTGASSGIGAAVVKDLVQSGMIVVGLARRKERMDALRDSLPPSLQQRLHIRKCDVSDLKSVTETFDWIEQKLGSVDVLVNNAGIIKEGQLLTQNVQDIQQVLQTNVMGVVYCTQRAVKSMRARNFDGHVILVNSIVGHKVITSVSNIMPLFSIYPATKFAITAITEVLRQELRGYKTKIKVTSISPGLVDTEILPEEFRKENMLRSVDISAGILYAIGTPPNVQVHELTIKPIGEVI